jgi:hypothetical protein
MYASTHAGQDKQAFYSILLLLQPPWTFLAYFGETLDSIRMPLAIILLERTPQGLLIQAIMDAQKTENLVRD